MIADSYELKEVEDAFFFEVEGSVRHQLYCSIRHTGGKVRLVRIRITAVGDCG